MKEFHNLQQQLVVKFETLLKSIPENETIVTFEENIDNSQNIYSLVTNEYITIIATVTTLTAGVAFVLVVSISSKTISPMIYL